MGTQITAHTARAPKRETDSLRPLPQVWLVRCHTTPRVVYRRRAGRSKPCLSRHTAPLRLLLGAAPMGLLPDQAHCLTTGDLSLLPWRLRCRDTTPEASKEDHSMDHPYATTLLDLIRAVMEYTSSEKETVATVAYFVNGSKVVLCGIFAGARIALSVCSVAPRAGQATREGTPPAEAKLLITSRSLPQGGSTKMTYAIRAPPRDYRPELRRSASCPS